jgi:uncharacterized protein YciI
MRRLFALVLFICVCALAQPVAVRQYLLRLEPVRKDFSLQSLNEDERRIVGEHVAHLRRLQADGKLVIAGQALDPNRGFWGILVVNAPNPETAAELMNADPAVKQKMLRGEVIPFRTVMMAVADPAAAR